MTERTKTGFKNKAGDHADTDEILKAELEAAGIFPLKLSFKPSGEVQTHIVGYLGPWKFERAWYYWMVKGPGIPPVEAEKLHAEFGQEVRVDGHCGCPSPLEWYKGFAVPHYHVDTQEGLKALADVIRDIMTKAGVEIKEPT